MKGWIYINVMSHGDYFRTLTCCRNDESPDNWVITKRRNVRSRNSEETYFKCVHCGQEFMEQHQTFICPHNERKKTNDTSYTLYVKKNE